VKRGFQTAGGLLAVCLRNGTGLQASARPARGDPVSFVVQQLTFFHFSAADFFILQQLALIIKSTKLI
jgi:hypothetical protein